MAVDLSAMHYLFGAGVCATCSAIISFRLRRTIPFKVSYLIAWPTLGSSVILYAQQHARQEMEESTSNSSDTIPKFQMHEAETKEGVKTDIMDAMRRAAGK